MHNPIQMALSDEACALLHVFVFLRHEVHDEKCAKTKFATDRAKLPTLLLHIATAALR